MKIGKTGCVIWAMILINVRAAGGTMCDETQRKGPYILELLPNDSKAPSQRVVNVTRAKVEKDAVLAILYRSFWSSYCYNGGALDGNTGCFHSITQELPDREEAAKWVERGKCKVFQDCSSCWGSDASLCLAPKATTEKWVAEKELRKMESNHHFAFHTCNLSWRCGLHITVFPTFLTWENNRWLTYTSYANGTILQLNNTDFWETGDAVLYKQSDAKIKENVAELPCFITKDKPIACYDREWGNFIEFKNSWVCLGKSCYLNPLEEQKGEGNTTLANLKAASIEDLRAIIQAEHMINEELRYNFGILLKEVQELRNILTQTIVSTAKIDDRLIGNIIGKPGRSKFVTEEKFFLDPCVKPSSENSNCAGNHIFKNGRWATNSRSTECVELKDTKTLSLFNKEDLWLPELKKGEFLGTSSDFEGWSYFAKEKDNMDKAMRWTENAESSSGIGDLYKYPKGFFDYSVVGFVTTHLGIIGVLAAVVWFLCRKKGQAAVEVHQNFELEPIVRQQEQMVSTPIGNPTARTSAAETPVERRRHQQARRSTRGLWARRDLI